MDAAAKHENRYRAVIEYANGAMFNVAELDAWAVSNKVPISFQKLLVDDGVKDGYDSARHYVSFEVLSVTIAWAIVPEDADPNDARVQLMAAHDTAEPDDPVSRLRDLVMLRYDRELLSAVFDGDLFLYDTLLMSRIDIGAARMRYDAEPEAYVHAAQARLIDTEHGAVTAADIERAKNTLEQRFARLDHLAWSIFILTAGAPPPGEERYRQILSITRWLQALGLPFRHSNGLPASQPKGIPVAGMDLREYQYLAVEDVRIAALKANYWPGKARFADVKTAADTSEMPRELSARVQPVADDAQAGPRPVVAPSRHRHQVSKAPPPIKHIPHSPPPDYFELNLEPRPPHWDDWRLMPDVEVWQAVALSLDIEPSQVRFNPQAWMGAEFPFDEGDDFNRRLRITLANLRDRARFPGTRNLSAGHRNSVNLVKFARFAVEFARWPVPEELRALADMARPAEATATALEPTATPGQDEDLHVSKMVEMACNNNEPIDWDYWAGKMPRWNTHQAVRLMAALDPDKHSNLSFKRNETAGAAKEQAKRLQTLAASHRMSEASPLEWLTWADGLNEPVHEGFRVAVMSAESKHEPYPAIQSGAAVKHDETLVHPEWPHEASKVASRPPLQQRHQENEILRVVRELGHNPKNLPKQKAGAPGVKATVRAKLKGLGSKKVFDLAWERLRKSGEIADDPPSN
jgi:hypothetical protein